MGANTSVESDELSQARKESMELKKTLKKLEEDHSDMKEQLDLQRDELRKMYQQPWDNDGGDVEDYDDSITCPVCLHPWGISGPHRLVSLSCGHLFGDECARRSIRKLGQCPQCRRGAEIKDIRPLYAQRVCAIDNVDNLTRGTKRPCECSDEALKKMKTNLH
ncbi:E3 ubiquitin-protein ligase RNF4-like [Scaptodrosophila lebanonensis]|uniref:E3 ubiquitin-protein ligase RNF4-like n=1 Tax=Drosophila lebanonensis TaxID=7225 RepID=A0A6J2TK84_DROLE|nr:E3 ubiquitin-protein ligase RNF4-like [Scaptodrosophila lebanonensis]